MVSVGETESEAPELGDWEPVPEFDGVPDNVGDKVPETVLETVRETVAELDGVSEGVPLRVPLTVPDKLDVPVCAGVLVTEGVMVTVFDIVRELEGVDVIEAPAEGVAEQDVCAAKPEVKQQPLVQGTGATEARGQ